MRMHAGVEVQLHILNLCFNGSERSLSLQGHFTQWERKSVTDFIGGWVCQKASLDAAEKRNIFCPYRKSNDDSSAVQPVASSL
jgi:hypothetical protein